MCWHNTIVLWRWYMPAGRVSCMYVHVRVSVCFFFWLFFFHQHVCMNAIQLCHEHCTFPGRPMLLLLYFVLQSLQRLESNGASMTLCVCQRVVSWSSAQPPESPASLSLSHLLLTTVAMDWLASSVWFP